MSLLPSHTSANATFVGIPTNYFLLEGAGGNNPGGNPTTDTAFIANGGGAVSGFSTNNPASKNVVLMCEDTVGSGKLGISFTDNSGVIRWGMATTSVEASGNVGSDFAILNYDNSGTLLASPIIIERATGNVGIEFNALVNGRLDASSAVVFNTLTASNLVATTNVACEALTVDGSNVVISKTGFAQALTAGPLTDAIAAGSSAVNVGSTFTVPVTGVYVLSGGIGINVDATNGATVGASDAVYLEVLPASGPGGVSVSLKPYTMPNTSSNGLDYGVSGTNLAVLTAGTTYQAKLAYDNVSGTMAFPGGLSASINLLGLCN